MQLRESEDVIKEGIVHYRGTGKPILSTCYGKLYLTKQRLLLDYFLFGIPISNKVVGIFRREIGVRLAKIVGIQKAWPDVVKIDYNHMGKRESIFFAPWKAFAPLTEVIRIANEWVLQIQIAKGH